MKKAKKKTTVKKNSLAIKNLVKKLSQNKKAYAAARKKVVAQGEILFKQAIKAIFKEFPTLDSFSWNEYTPHWNDGDECIFGVYFETLAINGEEDPESVWELDSLIELLSNKQKNKSKLEKELASLQKSGKDKDSWEVKNTQKKLDDIEERNLEQVLEEHTIKKTITDILEMIEEEVYQSMFGEGTIVVTRNGISIEQCSHD